MERLTKEKVIKMINNTLEGLYNYPEGESCLEEMGINYKAYKPFIYHYDDPEGIIEKVVVKYPGGKFKATYFKEWGIPAFISD